MMEKEIILKNKELQSSYYDNFKRFTSIDLLDEKSDMPVERNFSLLQDLMHGYTQWKLTFRDEFDGYEKDFGTLIPEYFKEDRSNFELTLLEILKKKAVELGAREFSMYLNNLSKALIIETIKRKAIRLMVSLSSNHY